MSSTGKADGRRERREQPLNTKNKLRRALYRLVYGRRDDYCCLFCGQSLGRFITTGKDLPAFRRWDVTGAGRRVNAKCPNCLSKDRARMVYLYLETRTRAFAEPTRVLHISPDVHLAEALRRHPTVDLVVGGIDLDPLRQFDPVRVDVREIPFEDNGFDVVLCNHVMEVVVEEEQGYREIYRVLKPGGFAIMQVPIGRKLEETIEGSGGMSRNEMVRLFGHDGAVRLHGRDYPKRLERIGFRVHRHNAYEERWTQDVKRHGLDPREDLYISCK